MQGCQVQQDSIEQRAIHSFLFQIVENFTISERQEEESPVILRDSMSLSVIEQDCSFYQLKLIINEDKNN